MSCKPPQGTPAGTLHTLRGGSKEEVYEWTGSAWSTPGTGWSTKASAMGVLGWRYVGPAAGVALPDPLREALHLIASTTTDPGAREEAQRALGVAIPLKDQK